MPAQTRTRPMTKRRKYWILALVAVFVSLLAAIAWNLSAALEKARQLGCQCNIKQVTIALLLYAEQNDGWFPDKEGDEGLLMLTKEMRDGMPLVKEPLVFRCPSVRTPPSSGICLDYVAGYRIDSNQNIGIVMDKVGNHRDYGNIGFVNGRVLPFAGQDWRRHATPGTREVTQAVRLREAPSP